MTKYFIRLLNYFIQPKSQNEDTKRREYVLNVLMLGTLGLSILAFLVTIFAGDFSSNYSPLIFGSVFGYILLVYFLMDRRKIKSASLALLAFYFLSASLLAISYGVENPYVYLIYALVITLSGILIESKTTFIAALFIGSALIFEAHLQSLNVIYPDLSWKQSGVEVPDVFVFWGILLIIAAISWIAGNQMEKSLIRARKSESALRRERNQLDEQVKERTEELRKEQLQRINQIEHLAEFGRVSSELIHDLSNPLSVISVNLEKLRKDDNALVVDRALRGARKMQDFISATRKQIQQQELIEEFELVEEISSAVQALQLRASKYGVRLKLDFDHKVSIIGNPVRFYQVMTNLISNAIDSYADIERSEKLVIIAVSEANKVITVKITDNGDQGSHRRHGNRFVF